MNTVNPDSTVTLRYQLLLDDGTLVEDNLDSDALTVTLGDGTLTSGMEDALCGRAAGETVEATLSPDMAFGYPDEENVHSMPLSDFADMKPEVGQVIAFDGPDDEEIHGTIVAIEGNEVSIDFSHPLAGRTLIFKAEILNIYGETA